MSLGVTKTQIARYYNQKGLKITFFWCFSLTLSSSFLHFLHPQLGKWHLEAPTHLVLLRHQYNPLRSWRPSIPMIEKIICLIKSKIANLWMNGFGTSAISGARSCRRIHLIENQNQHKITKDKMVAYLRRIGPGTSAHCSRRFHLNVTNFETKIVKRQKQKAKKAGRP